MAAQSAELARQEAEFNRRSRELAEAEAKVKAQQEEIEAARLEAIRVATLPHPQLMNSDQRREAHTEYEAGMLAEQGKIAVLQKVLDEGEEIEARRKAAQIAEQSKPFKHPGTVYSPVKEARPSRGAIIGCIASHFGVNEDMALDWVLAEFRGDIAFAARKEAA